MITNEMLQVVAEYDGWVNTGSIHPFNPQNGYQYRKEGLIGVSWLSKMAYATSMDWLHPVAIKAYSELIDCKYNDISDIADKCTMINLAIMYKPVNSQYIDLFKAVYEGIIFINQNK